MWNQGETEAQVIWQTRPALRTEEFLVAAGRLAHIAFPVLAALGRLFGQRP